MPLKNLLISPPKVSIPFKRDNSSEPARNVTSKTEGRLRFQFPSNGIIVPNSNGYSIQQINQTKFQFPSNGIIVPNTESCCRSTLRDSPVSIPFKRDNSSERYFFVSQSCTDLWFQFPSNGIIVPNCHKVVLCSHHYLFQFPSNGIIVPNKFHKHVLQLCNMFCFNSLQTG